MRDGHNVMSRLGVTAVTLIVLGSVVGSRAEEHHDWRLRIVLGRRRPAWPSVEGFGFGSVEEVVIAWRLVTGKSCGICDLCEMPDLVEQDV